jgi:hypothetical protein
MEAPGVDARTVSDAGHGKPQPPGLWLSCAICAQPSTSPQRNLVPQDDDIMIFDTP